jgi:hypothetical protein
LLYRLELSCCFGMFNGQADSTGCGLISSPMSSGTARLIRSLVLRRVGLPLLVLVLAVSVLVKPVTCNHRKHLVILLSSWIESSHC